MSTTVPSVSGDQEVIADATLARGSLSGRATIDLQSKPGAFLFVSLGRGGTAAIDVAISVEIRPTLGDDAKIHPNSSISRQSSVAAATSTTVDGDSAASQKILNVTTTAGFAAGELICIQDAGGGVTRLEWAKISKITNPGAGGELILQNDLAFAHSAAQADTVRNQADCFPAIWLPGGQNYEVFVDYGPAAAGDTITIRARSNVVDSYDTSG